MRLPYVCGVGRIISLHIWHSSTVLVRVLEYRYFSRESGCTEVASSTAPVATLCTSTRVRYSASIP